MVARLTEDLGITSAHQYPAPSVTVRDFTEQWMERFLGAVSTSDITQLITMETMGESRSPHARLESAVRVRQNQRM